MKKLSLSIGLLVSLFAGLGALSVPNSAEAYVADARIEGDVLVIEVECIVIGDDVTC